MGAFGYFPTYTLGNVYSAQLYEAARRDLPDLESGIEKGELMPLKEWMTEHVHRWGRRYDADDLIRLRKGERRSTERRVQQLARDLRDLGFRGISTGDVLDLLALGVDRAAIEAAREADPDLTLKGLIRQRRQAAPGGTDSTDSE